MKRCTACHSAHVRRSGVHPAEASLHPFRSPYRCLDCNARFWVVSRRARIGIVFLAALVLATFVGVGMATPSTIVVPIAATTIVVAALQIPAKDLLLKLLKALV